MTDAAWQALRPALVGAKGTIRRELLTGICHLYRTQDNSLYVVLRPEGRELVVVAVAGTRLRQARSEIINFAQTQGFTTIRFHTRHPERLQKGLAGLPVRLVETRKALWGNDERVYRMELHHGLI